MRNIFFISLVVLISGCATSRPDLPTQSNVDLSRYAGTWHEQARLPNRFQEDCVGDVQADYVLQADKTISVTNQCRVKDGSTKVAQGEGRFARGVNPPDPAKLQVRFAPSWLSWLPMVWGDYWIIKLDDDNQYSLVGTPDRQYLWVLSRDRQGDEASINALLDYAKSLGFPVSQMTRSGR